MSFLVGCAARIAKGQRPRLRDVGRDDTRRAVRGRDLQGRKIFRPYARQTVPDDRWPGKPSGRRCGAGVVVVRSPQRWIMPRGHEWCARRTLRHHHSFLDYSIVVRRPSGVSTDNDHGFRGAAHRHHQQDKPRSCGRVRRAHQRVPATGSRQGDASTGAVSSHTGVAAAPGKK